MKELSREYSIAPLAETLEVSKSGFYADQRKLQADVLNRTNSCLAG